MADGGHTGRWRLWMARHRKYAVTVVIAVIGLFCGVVAALASVKTAAMLVGGLASSLVFIACLMNPVLGLVILFASWYNPLVLFTRFNLLPVSYLLTLLFIVAVAVGIVVLRARGGFRVSAPGFWYWTPYVLILCVAGVYGAVNHYDPRFIVSDFLQLAEIPLLFYISAVVLRNVPKLSTMAVQGLVVFLTVAAVEVALVFASGAGILPGLRGVWELGVVGLGNLAFLRSSGNIPAAVLPVVVAILMVQNKPARPRWLTFALQASVIAASVSIILSWKRSAWFGAFVGCCLVLWLLRKSITWRRLAKFLAGTIICAAILVPISRLPLFSGHSTAELVSHRLEHTLIQYRDQDNIGRVSRLREYRVTKEALEQKPLLGEGLGAFYFGFKRGELDMKHFFHNAALGLVFRTGLLGAAAFAVGMIGTGLWWWRRWRMIPAGFEKAISAGAAAGVVGLMAQSVTAGVIFQHPHGGLAGMFLGIMTHAVGNAVEFDDSD